MNKIIFILFIILNTVVCFAEGHTVFEPNQTDNLWYTWAEYDGQDTEILCKYWDGTCWSKPYKLTDNFTNDLTPAVAMDNNKNPWVVWTRYDGISTSIYERHYDGKNWSNIRQVDDVDIYWDSTPTITIDKNNTPFVAWAGSNGSDDDIYVSHWDGRNWAPAVMVNNNDNTPDVMPVISTDKENNIILAWCGFDIDRYKLFFSRNIKNKWLEEKTVLGNNEQLSTDLPFILKNNDGTIELLWYAKSLCYKSSWDGINWSSPVSYEFLLPLDFLEPSSVGPAHISWIENNISQSLAIIPAKPRNPVTVRNTKKSLAWVNKILCPTIDAAVEENKYIAYGDSITTGYGDSWDIAPDTPAGYPVRLEVLLNEKIAPSIVLNEGNPGERTFGGAERINDVLNTDNAKFILIMEGTNDVTFVYSTETITFNLGVMVSNSTSFGTTPLVATLTPRMDGLDDRIKEDVNPAITRLALEKGITLVDQYTEFAKDKALYMVDSRLHPNAAGYELIAQIWFDAIDAIINPPPLPEEEEEGCGVAPPVYPNGGNNGLICNLIPLFILIILLKTLLQPSLKLFFH